MDEFNLPETFELAFDPYTSEDPAVQNLFTDHIGASLFCALRVGRLVDDRFNATVLALADELRALNNESMLNLANILRALRRTGCVIFGPAENVNDAALKVFGLLTGKYPLKIMTPAGRFLTRRSIELEGVLDLKKAKCVASDCDCITGHCLPRLVGCAGNANVANVERLLEKLNGRFVRVIVEWESGQSERVEIINE